MALGVLRSWVGEHGAAHALAGSIKLNQSHSHTLPLLTSLLLLGHVQKLWRACPLVSPVLAHIYSVCIASANFRLLHQLTFHAAAFEWTFLKDPLTWPLPTELWPHGVATFHGSVEPLPSAGTAAVRTGSNNNSARAICTMGTTN